MKLATAGLILALALPGQASAARFVVSVEGTTWRTEDGLGLFGDPLHYIPPQAFTLTMAFDTETPGATLTTGSYDTGGGVSYPTASLRGNGAAFPARVKFEIGGRSFHINALLPTDDGGISKFDVSGLDPFGYTDELGFDAIGGEDGFRFELLGRFNGDGPTSLFDGAALDARANFVAPNAYLDLFIYGLCGGPYCQGVTEFQSTDMRVTVAPAPEPAAWALIILGLGVAGAALRVRGRRLSMPEIHPGADGARRPFDAATRGRRSLLATVTVRLHCGSPAAGCLSPNELA